jgi:hypothetical protein
MRSAYRPALDDRRIDTRIQSRGVPTWLSSILQNPFSFLFARSTQEDRVAEYIMREHDRGRSLVEILEDPYVRNRCSPRETARILERPDVIKAIGDDVAEEARRGLDLAGG